MCREDADAQNDADADAGLADRGHGVAWKQGEAETNERRRLQMPMRECFYLDKQQD